MRSLKEQARNRFHRGFQLRSGPVLRDDAGVQIDLTSVELWHQNHGGFSFVIMRDPGAVDTTYKFSMSIRSHTDMRSNVVNEHDAYDTITQAKDACYDHYLRFRAGNIPKATPSEALARPGEKGVEITIVGGLE